MRAAYSGQLDVVKILLENGADVNSISFEGFPSFSAPVQSALSFARKGLSPSGEEGELSCWQDKKGKEEVVEYLLEQGAKI